MSNEAEKLPQQPSQQDPTKSARNSDTKTNSSQESQKQPDTSKKSPSLDSNPQHKDQAQKKQYRKLSGPGP